MSAKGRVLQAGIQNGAKVALAAMCLVAGGITFGTAPPVNLVHAVGRGTPLINIFNAVGVGLYLYYLTGTIEVVAAIGLLRPLTAAYAALLLIPTMGMAIANDVFILHGSVVLPVVLMIVATSVAWTTRKQFRRAFGAIIQGCACRASSHRAPVRQPHSTT
jgi:hypothetical protein